MGNALSVRGRMTTLTSCIIFSSFSGANPNSEDYDCRTPLHSAIVKGSRSYECVRLLLDGGADVNHKDRYVNATRNRLSDSYGGRGCN